MNLDKVLAATFALIAPHLTERQRRLLLGAAARALGYGLAVVAAVELVADGLAGGGLDRADAAQGGKRGVGGQAVGVRANCN